MTGLLVLAAAAAAIIPSGPLHVPPFDYPPAALKVGEHGRAAYSVTITAQGRIRHCRISESTGFTRLDRATCSVLERATAAPARRDGQPIETVKSGFLNWAVAAPAGVPLPVDAAPVPPPP